MKRAKEKWILKQCLQISNEMGVLCGFGPDEMKKRPDGVAICAIDPYGVQVYSGIEKLAEAAGKDLVTDSDYHDDYPTRKWFVHEGKRFYQLEKKEGGEQ